MRTSSRNSSRHDDCNLDDSLRALGNHRVLTREEELDLFQRMEAGETKAREELIRCNQRFVIKMAFGFRGCGVPLADLVMEGNIGLLQVVDKFDWRRGFRFSTYAAYYIRQEMQAAVHRSGSMIRIPVRKCRLMGKLEEAARGFEENEGREAMPEELAYLVGEDVEKVVDVLSLRHRFTSMDQQRGDESDGRTLRETLADEEAARPDEAITAEQTQEAVVHALDFLNDRERQVINLRYGFEQEDGQTYSLRGASDLVGLSQEGVRRVETRALDKLRRPAIRQRLEGLLSA